MWKIAFVLPNIKVGTSIETEFLALVDHDDERIAEIKTGQQNISRFLDGFIDDFNNPIKPSVMIYREDFPVNVISIDSIVAFRNMVAISTILINWTYDYTEVSPMGPLFSNNFDFYPITVQTDGSLITSNPAVLSFHSEDSPFIATPSREVPRVSMGFCDSNCNASSGNGISV